MNLSVNLSGKVQVESCQFPPGTGPTCHLHPAPCTLPPPSPMKRHSQRGIALILTLILLTIITFLTLAFLALSRREKGAVNVNLDQTRAKQAAETAAVRAQAQIIAQILATTNKWAYDLMVSTSFQNTNGFNPAPGPGLVSYTNASYTYANGAPLNAADFVQNSVNLFYDPRPPVFAEEPGAPTLDFRYYLDLNRNGRFDTNGLITAIGRDGLPLLDPNNRPILQTAVGDPEFVGILENLDQSHSPTNKFLERYAYIVLPAGKTLDLNYAHNQAKQISPASEGFLRNQGLGTWELNLAAALEDLNTNYWGSTVADPNDYRVPLLPPYTIAASTGPAFRDALALVRYRDNGSYANLAKASEIFGANSFFFMTDLLDQYGNGPLTTNATALFDGPRDNTVRPWPGAESTNAFFNHQELFDTNKTDLGRVGYPTFSDRLSEAGTNISTHDRYTFYRLLSTLGLDSAPEPAGKINVNFINTDGFSETNLYPWPASGFIDNGVYYPGFFTNAIDRLLRDPRLQPYPILSATNIPIYPTNYYTPAVHRLLQLAANIYDATHTNALPTVFRPRFQDRGDHIAIAGWAEVTDANAFLATTVYKDPTNMTGVGPDDLVLASGIPLVIGAKKELPNFNEFALQTIIQAGRKLELRRANATSFPNETNQMYYFAISNVFGMEAWNSYTNNYPRPLQMRTYLSLTWTLTNEVGALWQTNYTSPPNGQPWNTLNIAATGWAGASRGLATYSAADTNAFRVPISGGFLVVTNSAYIQNPAGGGVFGSHRTLFPRTGVFPVPQIWLTTSARVRYALVDTVENRLVDFVNLANLERTVNLGAELMSLDAGDEPGVIAEQWRTNRVGGQTVSFPTEGIISQIQVSLGNLDTSLSDWTSYGGNSGGVLDKEKAIDGFRVFLGLTPISASGQANPPNMTNLVIQTPFNPARKLSLQSTWQANDPLVHYLPGDLSYLVKTNEIEFVTPPNTMPSRLLANLGRFNLRTTPWGGNSLTSTDTNNYAIELKDPGVRRSDNWEFPNGPLANVGWLGRVHRGSPWQTVYLKDRWVKPGQWLNWSGNYQFRPDLRYQVAVDDAFWSRFQAWPTNDNAALDGFYSQPIKDTAVLEHFTATFDARTTRGQVSINNTNLAAWSAVLSGVFVMSNNIPDPGFNNPYLQPEFTPVKIESAGHAGTNSTLGRIVDGINRTRANTNVFPKQVFTQLGDLLLVPELTTRSPFLTNSTIQLQRGLTDAAVERIPQQVLGLLRGDDDPRFVIYAYGQALRPAANSLVIGGPYNRLCTNYAITAEAAFRTVIRVVGAPEAPRAVVESFNFLPPD